MKIKVSLRSILIGIALLSTILAIVAPRMREEAYWRSLKAIDVESTFTMEGREHDVYSFGYLADPDAIDYVFQTRRLDHINIEVYVPNNRLDLDDALRPFVGLSNLRYLRRLSLEIMSETRLVFEDEVDDVPLSSSLDLMSSGRFGEPPEEIAIFGAFPPNPTLSVFSIYLEPFVGRCLFEKVAQAYPALKVMSVYIGREFDEASLEPLSSLRRLQGMYVNGVSLEGFFFSKLAETSTVKELWIENGSIGQEGIDQLSRISSLRRLGIRSISSSSDLDVRCLADLSHLQELVLDWKLSDEQLIVLKDQLPGCKIYTRNVGRVPPLEVLRGMSFPLLHESID